MPAWLKILIPAVLVLALLVAVVVMFFFEQPPPYAQPGAIEARFGLQLAELRGLAKVVPVEGCAVFSLKTDDIDEAKALIAAWRDRVKGSRPLFDDPAILGARLVRDCGGTERTFGIKPYHDWRAMSRATWLPARDWPSVSISYVGRQRIIQYEDRIENEGATLTTLHLVLDLANLEVPGDG